jgi:hypothetical protein
MRSTVDHQAVAAKAKRRATRPRRARTAANAGANPVAAAGGSFAEAINGSAAQRISDLERPDLPSNSMPKALSFERVAFDTVKSELGMLVGRTLIDEHAQTPTAVRHDHAPSFGKERMTCARPRSITAVTLRA